MVRIADNFFTKEQHRQVLDYCIKCPYRFGVTDSPDTPPTGLMHLFELNELGQLFLDRINSMSDLPKGTFELYNYRINCFAPLEQAYFHTDGPKGDVTFLYYPNMEWKPDDGGETQIYEVDTHFIGIPPIPNRMVMFDASYLHRATPFRDRHRFTIAVNYRQLTDNP